MSDPSTVSDPGRGDALLRAFIAVEVTAPVRQAAAELQQDLAQSGADVKWVDPANLHLTLLFLGTVPADLVERTAVSLRALAAEFAPFDFRVAGIGYFGRRRRPRVIWAGITRGTEALGRLYDAAVEAATDAGLGMDVRPFRAHLTLGRVRRFAGSAELVHRLEERADAVLGEGRAAAIRIVKSVLTPRGPVYSVLHDISLSDE